ncbi:MAG: ABC transporter permease subunit [Candidatus Marinimicrobia bacterium]|nr:ABC transporter permease subunit [Candidatus Neomarinimicrobiota bacterium]
MHHLIRMAKTDIGESIRSRWFFVYTIVFGTIMVGLLVSGLTESRIMGFTGLSRLLVTYIQITMAILPIFMLITTVRSVVGDREAGVYEYMLSLPVGLAAWYWGKLIGRFITVFLPVLMAMMLAVVWGMFKGVAIPWTQVLLYTSLLAGMIICFLGIGMLISTFSKSTDVAQGAAFLVWLFLLLFLDLILLGTLIREGLPAETAIGIALANPLQAFRTAAMLLFDPHLVLLGPSAYVILDLFGRIGYLVWAMVYPVFLGFLTAIIGFWGFRRGDLS